MKRKFDIFKNLILKMIGFAIGAPIEDLYKGQGSRMLLA